VLAKGYIGDDGLNLIFTKESFSPKAVALFCNLAMSLNSGQIKQSNNKASAD